MSKFIPLLVALLVFVVLVTIFHLSAKSHFKSYVQELGVLFAESVKDYANCLSLSYFQWSKMYELLSEDNLEEASILFEELKSYFPEIEEVKVLNESGDFDYFKIDSKNGKLHMYFKVYNDDLSDFVSDKLVLAVVDAQKLLDKFGVTHIRISPTGKEFVYGLRYKLRKSALDSFSIFSSVLLAVGTFLAVQMVRLRINLSRERKFRKLHEALTQISEYYLKGQNGEKLYQLILEKAIEVVPNAQAGSVLLKKQDKHVYVAAVGYDLEGLSKIEYPESVQKKWLEKPIKKKSDMVNFNREDEKTLEILKKHGRVEEIVCSLVVPVQIGNEIVLSFNLENFEREDAFDEESLQIAKLFANYVGMVFLKIKRDEQIMQQQKMMEYLYNHDPLTGLLNRRAFEEYGEKLLSLAKRERKKVALLFLDLRRFKNVNDKYGHETGDLVLKVLGSRLEKVFRESDVVSRFGGDEFVALLYDCDGNNFAQLLNRVFQIVEEPIQLDDKSFQVGVNVGVAIYPDDARELDQLIRLADMAMYYAKKKGLRYATASEVETGI
ncbi:MAG: sensor domain-containing diguanylate cyclase [Pseudothermotoga sp.]|nr:sensor domain-containing diguanylate cyclase [Pseudothermotoga sp.]